MTKVYLLSRFSKLKMSEFSIQSLIEGILPAFINSWKILSTKSHLENKLINGGSLDNGG